MKTIGGILLLALLLLFMPPVAWACEHCLGTGGANGPTIRALIFSMAALLSMVSFVGVGIGVFFFKTARRSRQLMPGALEVNARGDLEPSPLS